MSGKAERDRWANMAIMLRNTFAMANMARHNIPDIEGRARRLNERFLSGLSENLAGSFEYFYKVMLNLKEAVSEAEFKDLLKQFLEKFVGLAHREP